MGFFDDLGHLGKDIGHGIVRGADIATDTIIDKDAWGRTLQAMADGPGGKTVKGSDLLNMALDSTMLIPGVGLAGGVARVGARTAGKLAAREATEALAKKEAQTLLRSPLNNRIRQVVGSKTDDLVGKAIRSGGGSRVATATTEKVAAGGGKRAAARATEKETSNQIKRMALKQEKGIGTKVGFGQSKRRLLLNTALAGGANLGVRAYDELTAPRAQQVEPRPMLQTKAGGEGGYGAPGTVYITGSDGQQMELPAGLMETLAAFMKQNGTVDGSQVIYNK